jgi:hypothetical protein
LERRLEVREPANELDRLANDWLRHAAAQSRAVDAVGQIEMRCGVDRFAGVIQQPCWNRRLSADAVGAVFTKGDGTDILRALKNRQLHGAIVAAGVKHAHGERRASGRQGLDVERRLGRALDQARAFLGVAVGDQEIADLFRDNRLEESFLKLRQTLGSPGGDFELVAVGRCQDKGVSALRRVGPAVVIRAGFDLGGGVCARHLCGVHRQLSRQRVGFLA